MCITSLIHDRYHNNSLVASAAAIYSASAEDIATEVCFFDNQFITSPLNRITTPVVLLPSPLSPVTWNPALKKKKPICNGKLKGDAAKLLVNIKDGQWLGKFSPSDLVLMMGDRLGRSETDRWQIKPELPELGHEVIRCISITGSAKDFHCGSNADAATLHNCLQLL